MKLLPEIKKLQFGFVVFVVLMSINLWTFQMLGEDIYKMGDALVLAGVLLIIIGNSYIFTKKNLPFKTNALLFILFPCLSAFGAYIYHDQPMVLSFIWLRTIFLWLFYFVLHIFKIPREKIIGLMIFTGCVWVFLTIVQQFTYPTALFYSREDSERGSILRAGVYRFMPGGMQYGLFVLMYFFYKYLTTTSREKMYSLLYVVGGLLGIYYYGTRQYILSSLMCMGMTILLLKANARAKYLMLLVPVLVMAWAFKDVLFGQMIEFTSQQMEYGYEEDIRMLSADFYLNDYWPHWTAKLIGNGQEHIKSDYGKEMQLILAYFHFYRSDVGIIGTFNKFGIFYVLSVLWIIIKVLTIKIPNKKDRYLKLLFYNALFLLIINDAFTSQAGIPFYCLILYLIDTSIAEQKEQNTSLQETAT